MLWKPETVETALDLFYDDKDIALIILDVMMTENEWLGSVTVKSRESSKDRSHYD